MSKSAKEPARDATNRSILINFVLDKSGSMDVLRDATISGFNEFKNDQAKEDGEAFFTLTLFDTRFDTVCKAVPVREVADLSYQSYEPGGMTALYDAIGYTIRLTDEFVALHKPDQVLFVIMTDGQENSSREFTQQQIFQMIAERQELAEYEFIYLGANQDSYMTGRAMGVRDGRMMDWAADDGGARSAMLKASHNARAYRRHGMKQQETFFNQAMEDLGAIDAAAWKAMTEEERKRHLDKGQDNTA
jgi:hypothetical protein